MDGTEARIEELEERIAALPRGYISHKVINGKTQAYLQWTEDGAKKSRYLNRRDAEILAGKIEERRALQRQLKQLKLENPLPKRPGREGSREPGGRFRAKVLAGEALAEFAAPAARLRPRDCLGEIEGFLFGGHTDKVLVLFGLRRTGKTTLIRQAICRMGKEDRARAAFVQVAPSTTLADVYHDLECLAGAGFRYVFVDEATLMDDFVEGSALFPDIYAARGMRIVLSGTDSLGFVFTQDEQLFDRCITVHTTFIPYREFERVLGVGGIDEYIRYGGTMSLEGERYNVDSTFASEKAAGEYVDSAIARNIQHSLRCYRHGGHFRHLQELYDADELTNVVNRIVEDMNHRFTAEVIDRDFVSGDLAISARNLRNDRDRPTAILDTIDRETFTARLKEALEILNRSEREIPVEEAHRAEIREYLDLLELTCDIGIETLPPQRGRLARTAIAQPGLRYAQAKALVAQLLRDPVFADIPAGELARIRTRIMSEIEGRMLEDIVLLETQRARPDARVFKLQFAVGEYDMVVADPEAPACEVYEVKHSDKAVVQQRVHLVDAEKRAMVEFRYGPITRTCVLYRGVPCVEDGVEYRNVEDYLRSLGT